MPCSPQQLRAVLRVVPERVSQSRQVESLFGRSTVLRVIDAITALSDRIRTQMPAFLEGLGRTFSYSRLGGGLSAQ